MIPWLRSASAIVSSLMPRRRHIWISLTRSTSRGAKVSMSAPMMPSERHSISRSSGHPVRRLNSSSVSVSGIQKPPLVKNAGELVAPGPAVRLEVARLSDDEGDGVFAAVAHANIDLGERDLLGPFLRAAVEVDERLAAMIR